MSDNLCYGCMEHIEEGTTCSCGFDGASYETAPHQLIPGTLLQNRYMVGKVLGEGGFGITYVGRDTVLDMKVAVKEFYMTGYVNRNNTFSPDIQVSIGEHAEQFDKNKEKFLTEARVLAKFAYEDGIVGIQDFFEANNTAYIVMDFLTGETLKERIKREGKLSWQCTMELMKPIIKSLGVVHENNIIHRDISPDNIMLTDGGKVNLLDFGAARQVSDSDIKSLSVILKPGYAPEEQYRSKGQQGPWTDIYALCATIYCCITGVVPDDSMERMFDDKLRSPHEVEPSCSVAISNVIMRGMAVRQKDRYQTIDELRADLENAMAAPDDASIAAPVAGAAQPVPAAVVTEAVQPQRLASDPNATVYAAEIVDGEMPTPQPAPRPVQPAPAPAPQPAPTPAPRPVQSAPRQVAQSLSPARPLQGNAPTPAPQPVPRPVQPAPTPVQPVQQAPQYGQAQPQYGQSAPQYGQPQYAQPLRHAPKQKTAFEQAVADAKVRQPYSIGGNQSEAPKKKHFWNRKDS